MYMHHANRPESPGEHIFPQEDRGRLHKRFPHVRLDMDVSWHPKQALIVTFSDDGIHWDARRGIDAYIGYAAGNIADM